MTRLTDAAEVVLHDLEVLLPSPVPGQRDCAIGFSQLSGELSKHWGVHKSVKLPGYAPLTEDQKAAVEHAIPQIEKWSEVIANKVMKPWCSEDAQIYVLDWELDDVGRFEGCIQDQIDAVKEGGHVASTIFAVGERSGDTEPKGDEEENTENLRDAARLVTARIGHGPTWTSEDGMTMKWEEHDISLIQGAHLRQTSNKVWLQQQRGEEPSQRTINTARRLTDELRDRHFTFRNCTSGVLWGQLDESTKARCSLFEMTNRYYLGLDGELSPAANNKFDLKSCFDIARDCERLHIPLVDVHGSMLKLHPQTFNQMEGWSGVLDADLADPKPFRRENRRNQSLIARWTAQVEADVRGVHDDDYMTYHLLPRIRTFLRDDPRAGTALTEDEKARIVERFPWLLDSLNVSHYSCGSAHSTRTMRCPAIVDNTLNSCNNTLSDTLGRLLDASAAKHHRFLPCHIDYQALGQGKRVPTIRLDIDNPTTFPAVAGDESAYSSEFAKILRTMMQDDSSSAGGSGERIVDKETAESVRTWMRWQQTMASAIHEHLGSFYQESDADGLNMAQGVLSACENGPMITVARSVLSQD